MPGEFTPASARIQTMMPPTHENLERFIQAYARFGAYWQIGRAHV